MILTAALAATLPVLPATAASAGAMRDGEITVHSVGKTAFVGDERTVCRFYLAANGFHGRDQISYRVQRNAASGTVSTSGSIYLRNGMGTSGNIGVPDGPYTVTWYTDGSSAPIGRKEITVACGGANSTETRPMELSEALSWTPIFDR